MGHLNIRAWCSVKNDWATFTLQGCRHCRDSRRKDHQRDRKAHFRRKRVERGRG